MSSSITSRTTRTAILTITALAGLSLSLHAGMASEPAVVSGAVGGAGEVGDEVIVIGTLYEGPDADVVHGEHVHQAVLDDKEHRAIVRSVARQNANQAAEQKLAEPTATRRTKMIVTQRDADEEKVIRVEINGDQRLVLLNNKAVDARFLRDRDGRLEILDDSDAVIASVNLPEIPGSGTTKRVVVGHPIPVQNDAQGKANDVFLGHPVRVQNYATLTGGAQPALPGQAAAPRRVIMGITMSEPSPVLRAQLRLDPDTPAVVLDSVLDGYPAAKAGLKPFDVVVGHSESSLVRAISEQRTGSTMSINVLSGGEKRDVRVVFNRSPDSAGDGSRIFVTRPGGGAVSGLATIPASPDAPDAPGLPNRAERFSLDLPEGVVSWFGGADRRGLGADDQGAQEAQKAIEDAVKQALAQAMSALDSIDIEEEVRAQTRQKIESTIVELHERMRDMDSVQNLDANVFSRFPALLNRNADGEDNDETDVRWGVRLFDPDRGDVLNFPGNRFVQRGGAIEAEAVEQMESRLQQLESMIESRLDAIESRMDSQLDRLTVLMERLERRGR